MSLERLYPINPTRPFYEIISYYWGDNERLQRDVIHLASYHEEISQTMSSNPMHHRQPVIPHNKFSIYISYPFENPCEITIASETPVPLSKVYQSIVDFVYNCYQIEEKTATRQEYNMVSPCPFTHTHKKPTNPFLCSICYQEVNETQIQETPHLHIQLPCNHLFHAVCLDKWIQTCRTETKRPCCPMCRSFQLWDCEHCEGTGERIETIEDIMDPNLRTNVYRPPSYGQYGIYESYYEDLVITHMYYHIHKRTLFVCLKNRHFLSI